jgi:thioredoxin-like negative regulator of GroEL
MSPRSGRPTGAPGSPERRGRRRPVPVTSVVILLAVLLSALLTVISGLGGQGEDEVLAIGEPRTGRPPVGSPPLPPEVGSPEQWQKIVTGLREQAAAQPGDRDLRIALALALRAAGELEEAETAYLALLAGGEDPYLRVRLGNVLRDQGRLEEAEQAYRQALSANPAIVTGYLDLAELLWRQAKEEEALDLLEYGTGQVAPEAAPRLEDMRRALTEGLTPIAPSD